MYLSCGQRYVINNTNPTVVERARYINAARAYHFVSIAYFFETPIEQCLLRNTGRTGKERIPDKGIHATGRKLILPSLDEGFASIHIVNTSGEVRPENRA